MEIWKDIPGFEGKYQVSDQGRVAGRKHRILKPQLINSGYLVVHPMLHGARKIALVHRLVALAFLGVPEGAAEVNHKNFDKCDNRATNLEWVTHAQNVAHTVASGRARAPRNPVVGVSLSDGHMVTFPSQTAAEKAFAGRNTSAVHNNIVGKSKSAYGYTWSRYADHVF